jgi:hypothetical protein
VPDASDFRAILDAVPVSISVSSAVRDADGKIVDFRTEYVNPAGAEASGISPDEQVGLLAGDVLPDFQESELFRDAVRVVETGEPLVHAALPMEVDLDGGRHVSGTYEVEVRKLGDGLISVSRDVSERLAAEAELARTRAEVERRRFAERQVTEINDKILESLVEASLALERGDERAAHRAVQDTLKQASRIITDLRAVPRRG